MISKSFLYLVLSSSNLSLYIFFSLSDSLAHFSAHSDEKVFNAFKTGFEKEKDIAIKLNGYLKSYGEIIQLYQSYNENPEMTIEKISKLLKDSSVNLFKDEKLNSFTFSVKYKKQGNQISEANLYELD